MTAEMDIYGVFVPALFVLALIAALITTFIRRILVSLRVYRAVWHRSLFDLALCVVVLGGVFLSYHSFGPSGLPVPGQ